MPEPGDGVVRWLNQAVGHLAVLDDRVRRQLYEYVTGQAHPTTRDEAAAAVGVSSRLAAVHLDKLVDKGLLRAHYARKPGRSGPGAGRSSKYYRPSGVEIDVSIPERRYDLIGRILVDALDEHHTPDPGALNARARAVARRLGERLGAEWDSGSASSRDLAALHPAAAVLSGYGYAPHFDGPGSLTLTNCPFRSLASRNPGLVCAINEAFIDGVLRGIHAGGLVTSLEPNPDGCCVRVTAEGPLEAPA
ncbi:helix-turn-helix transcriptional regulator [Prauserella flavalba]|uniref:Transcriptional regulator n=1 Tax=Prauserella flavalba TaxID=1477506 RepID=A0A318LKD9_9PSEU|nr:transcriptional regulator [Prauserella flavalba]PXY28839.1 hypothetical protein BA062_23705 [Prauserella flavalba]